MVVDPSSGWMYGFPKIKTCDTPVADWLIENGYPEDHKHMASYYRFWFEDIYELIVDKSDYNKMLDIFDKHITEDTFDLVKVLDFMSCNLLYFLWFIHNNKNIVINDDLISYAKTLKFVKNDTDKYIWKELINNPTDNYYYNIGKYITKTERLNTDAWFDFFVYLCERFSDDEDAQYTLDTLMEFNW